VCIDQKKRRSRNFLREFDHDSLWNNFWVLTFFSAKQKIRSYEDWEQSPSARKIRDIEVLYMDRDYIEADRPMYQFLVCIPLIQGLLIEDYYKKSVR
jgi:hypothetical protein